MFENFDLWQTLFTIFGFLATGFTVVKVIVGKVIKFVDEAEDVISASAQVLVSSSEALSVIIDSLQVDADGSLKITPEEFEKIKKEVKEVKVDAQKIPKEVEEALVSLKAIFKKAK